MACFLLRFTRTVRTRTGPNKAKGSDVSGRTVIASVFLFLTLTIGFPSPAVMASPALSPGWIASQAEQNDWRVATGIYTPADTFAGGSPSEHSPSPTDDPSQEAPASGSGAFDLFDVRGDLDRVRGILKSRLIDVPDFGQAVPDPNVLAIFGLGLLALGFIRRLIA